MGLRVVIDGSCHFYLTRAHIKGWIRTGEAIKVSFSFDRRLLIASEYKKQKVKSKFICYGELKRSKGRCKRIAFYTSSARRKLNREVKNLLEVDI